MSRPLRVCEFTADSPCAWWFCAERVLPCLSFFGQRSWRTGPSSWCTRRCGAHLSGSTLHLSGELSLHARSGSHTSPLHYWGEKLTVTHKFTAELIESERWAERNKLILENLLKNLNNALFCCSSLLPHTKTFNPDVLLMMAITSCVTNDNNQNTFRAEHTNIKPVRLNKWNPAFMKHIIFLFVVPNSFTDHLNHESKGMTLF